ncbi:MAG: hypothetical protein J6Q80_03730, partial [Lentisphaeria bacterium]|nr:hypothetical protein [Lentisphaeria bacterium]
MYRKRELAELVESSFGFMLSRLEERVADYPFTDTKFNIRSGADFTCSDEYFRRRDHIYGWIQGRALESIAIHAGFFERRGKNDLACRCDKI